MACRSAAKVKAITVDCDECGKPYKALPNAIAKFGRRFCSVQCSSNSKKRGVEKTCPICDTKFWCQAHREASNRGTFCSIKCYRVGSMTRPERIVDDWLEARGVARERQKKFRIGFVDFFVPHANMVIEVDGDYWHSLPKQISKDRRRNAYLEKIGVKVVRVKECDIYADLDAAMLPTGL